MQGKTLRKMRMEIFWSQKTMARILGITRSSIAHYEQDRAPIPFSIVKKIAILHNEITRVIKTIK